MLVILDHKAKIEHLQLYFVLTAHLRIKKTFINYNTLMPNVISIQTCNANPGGSDVYWLQQMHIHVRIIGYRHGSFIPTPILMHCYGKCR